ncbi:hypothetical protein [Sphingobium yanoikuyae]|jgi:hypothetical protein|uniref:hypothetical protein n=2 Tax=Sphingomonadaceae TaxID=41297 RepID=UPI0010CA959A|nr:hypothetical protein [Sphingobium yanoikuyae]
MSDKTTLIAKIAQVSLSAFPTSLGEALLTPVKVGAHNIVTGWCVFELTAAVVGNKALESYALEFHDTHDLVSALAPRIVQRQEES